MKATVSSGEEGILDNVLLPLKLGSVLPGYPYVDSRNDLRMKVLHLSRARDLRSLLFITPHAS